MRITKDVTFEAAHLLPNVPEGHKCARLHGHSFGVGISVDGPIGETSGWVLDFADLSAAWAPLHDALDHHYLNEVEGLEMPTSERLAQWVFDGLIDALPLLSRVRIYESTTSWAEVTR